MSELDKLEKYLHEHEFEYSRGKIFSIVNFQNVEDLKIIGEQIIVYKDGNREWDAICTLYSYGGEDGLLEIYGNIVNDDDVRGYLSAENVIEILEGK